MKFNQDIIKKYLEAHPERAYRRNQYKIISDITGVGEETCKFICNSQRIIRMFIRPEKDKHEQQHLALGELGYNEEAIHDHA